MRIVALSILMALIIVPTADAAVTFGRDKLRGTTKTQADFATPVCPDGTTLSNQGGECVAKPSCPAGTTMQDGNPCVAPDIDEGTVAIPDGADGAP